VKGWNDTRQLFCDWSYLRVAAANNARAKLLENWRWKMPLWTLSDRAQWDGDMKSNYDYFIKANPSFKNANF